LYIAQAKKETADRSSAIAYTETSSNSIGVSYGQTSSPATIGGGVNLVNNGSSAKNTSSIAISGNFEGCGVNIYPSIAGISKVLSVNSNGYTLASGHKVLWGSCSTVAPCAVGDYLGYNGYVVNGIVNALRIQRVLLN
jgi:hypothetical protein